MSYRTEVVTSFVDREALTEAVRLLGEQQGHPLALEECRDGVRIYAGRTGADLFVKLPGQYDLGFNAPRAMGQPYKMVCDGELLHEGVSRGAEGRALIGVNAERLTQAYAEACMTLEWNGLGRSIERRVENGEVYLTLVEN